MRHHWNPENIAVFTQLMYEFGELARVVHYRARHIAPDKMQRIREVVSHASAEIKAILEE